MAEHKGGGISQPGADAEHPVPSGSMDFGPRGDLRSWPDETHVTDEDVPELREFIQLGPAEDPSDASHPRSIAHIERAVVGITTDGHGPELEDLERASVSTDPRLPEEGAAPAGGRHEKGDAEQEGRENENRNRGHHDVEASFHVRSPVRGDRMAATTWLRSIGTR